MGLVATSKGGGNFPVAPAGMHVARCYMVVDLGTQPVTFQGEQKDPAHKVRIGFELPEETHVFIEEKGPEPFTLSREYTLSTHEKARLRKDLESWRGRPFTAEELKGFDVSKLLGAACMVNVVHKDKADGGKRAEIAAITGLPKSMKCPPAVLKKVLYLIENGRDEVFESLPNWIKETISGSFEFREGPAAEAPDASSEDDHSNGDPEKDDVPF